MICCESIVKILWTQHFPLVSSSITRLRQLPFKSNNFNNYNQNEKIDLNENIYTMITYVNITYDENI